MVLNYLVNDLKELNLWDSEMSDQLKYFDGELASIDKIPDDIKKKYGPLSMFPLNMCGRSTPSKMDRSVSIC